MHFGRTRFSPQLDREVAEFSLRAWPDKSSEPCNLILPRLPISLIAPTLKSFWCIPTAGAGELQELSWLP